MKKRLLYEGVLFFLGAMLLMAGGCSGGEASFEETDPLDTPVSLKLVTRADNNATNNEQSVKRLRLLVYDKDGELEANQLFEGADLQGQGAFNEREYTIQTTLSLRTGRKTFCVVGNETAALATKLTDANQVGTLAGFLSSQLRWETRPSAPLGDDEMPMSGMMEISVVPSKKNTFTLALTKCVQRVDVTFANESSKTFTLVKTEIMRTPKWSPVMEQTAPVTFTATELETVVLSATETALTTTNKVLTLPAAYLFEHAPAQDTDLTALRVIYKQNGMTMTLPPLPLLGKATPESYYVKRNNLLKLTMTIRDSGYTIECENWTVDDYNVNSGGRPTTLTFKLEAPTQWEDGEPMDPDSWNNQEWEVIL